MKCPVCNVDLMIADRQGVEIDYCPKCRGVWLDRGELDKIIERSASIEREYDDYERRYHMKEYDDDYYKYKKKKRRFWDDIFDFD
ncbi:MAG: hypothetical protein KatS3mg003_2142 [Candidatus Nitrosocaldaceae archaeon]|nr:MAG: hypothetical protein KatS3mg003_2142 [Candidatus Nitrosocaldaceae archaeon]